MRSRVPRSLRTDSFRCLGSSSICSCVGCQYQQKAKNAIPWSAPVQSVVPLLQLSSRQPRWLAIRNSSSIRLVSRGASWPTLRVGQRCRPAQRRSIGPTVHAVLAIRRLICATPATRSHDKSPRDNVVNGPAAKSIAFHFTALASTDEEKTGRPANQSARTIGLPPHAPDFNQCGSCLSRGRLRLFDAGHHGPTADTAHPASLACQIIHSAGPPARSICSKAASRIKGVARSSAFEIALDSGYLVRGLWAPDKGRKSAYR
jgi:hypothetical protein